MKKLVIILSFILCFMSFPVIAEEKTYNIPINTPDLTGVMGDVYMEYILYNNESGAEMERWQSKGQDAHMVSIPVGTYSVLGNPASPIEKYSISAETTFTVDGSDTPMIVYVAPSYTANAVLKYKRYIDTFAFPKKYGDVRMKYQLFDANHKELENWITTGKDTHVVNLPEGAYSVEGIPITHIDATITAKTTFSVTSNTAEPQHIVVQIGIEEPEPPNNTVPSIQLSNEQQNNVTQNNPAETEVNIKTEQPVPSTTAQTQKENQTVIKIKAKGLKNNTLKIKKGKSVKLKVQSKKKAKFKSSNKKIVTVTKSGKVKAKKRGKAFVTVKVGNKTQKIKVIVK